jgi:hypothetical protein
MEGLKMIPYLALIICISGVIIGAGAIMLGKFGTTMTQCYNSSYRLEAGGRYCSNATVNSPGTTTVGNMNLTDEYYAIAKSNEGVSTVGEQQPTIAIIAVMVIIISVIAGVFVYMRMFA